MKKKISAINALTENGFLPSHNLATRNSCMSVALNMFRSFGFDRDQMISNLQRMFPAWIMTLSIWLISSGGQSTTK